MTAIGSTQPAGTSTSINGGGGNVSGLGTGGGTGQVGGTQQRRQQPSQASSYDGPVQRSPYTQTAANNAPGAAGALSAPSAGGATQQRRPPSTQFTGEQTHDQHLSASQAKEGGVPGDRVTRAGIQGLTNVDPNLTAGPHESRSDHMTIKRGDKTVWSGKVDGLSDDHRLSQFEEASRSVIKDTRANGTATGRPVTTQNTSNAIANGISKDWGDFQSERGTRYRAPDDFRG